jgi:uncharacterized protein (DUF58 family)
MPAPALNHPLDDLSEADLARLARVADPLLAGRPLLSAGHRPHRLRAGHGYEFLDYQEYVAGADLRNLDWRATARSRRPQLRRQRDEQTSDWQLCLDRSASMTTAAGRKWRLAVQLTAALGYLLLHLGHRTGLLGFTDDCTVLLPSGRGRHHYARLAQRLHDMAPSGDGGSDLSRCAARLPPRHQLIIVSDFLAPQAMLPALRCLAATGRAMHLMHVMDRADVTLTTGDAAVELLDVENRQRLSLIPTPAAVHAAQAAADALRTTLSAFCLDHGLRYTPCDTAGHWKAIVMEHLSGFKATHA